MEVTAQDPVKRRAMLEKRLADARVEMTQMFASHDRYEKGIEMPRILQEIRALEFEITGIDQQ
jgi:hypothetical protein